MGLTVPQTQLVNRPTFEPALTTAVVFFVLSLIVGWRLRQHKFQVYIYILAFTILRVLGYSFRAAWAKDLFNYGLYFTSLLFINIAQFLLLISIYLALLNWVSTHLSAIGDEVSLDEARFVKVAIVGLPLFQVINIVSSLVLLFMSQPTPSLIDSVSKCRQTAAIGFLAMVVIYCLMVSIYFTRFAKSKVVPRTYGVLLALGILLVVRYSYKVTVLYEPLTHPSQNEIYYFLLDPLVEIIVVIIATAFDLEEIRFTKPDDVEAEDKNEMIAA